MDVFFWILLGFSLGLFAYRKWFHVFDDLIDMFKDKLK